MDDRLDKINQLNKKLNPPKELGGVFLPRGFKECFDFIFVAERPSENKPKGWDGKSNYNFDVTDRDKFFQEMIVDNDVVGSYATDIVKEKGEPGQPTREMIEEWLPFLLKEIKIIQPKYIVVIGKRTFDESFKPFVQPHIANIGKIIKVDWVYHYSQQGGKTKLEVEQRFREVVNKMRNS